MSPLSHPEPCPHLVTIRDFVLCTVYPYRPKECVNHEYPARFCPIGLDVLKLDPSDSDKVRSRIDEGWELIKKRKEGAIPPRPNGGGILA